MSTKRNPKRSRPLTRVEARIVEALGDTDSIRGRLFAALIDVRAMNAASGTTDTRSAARRAATVRRKAKTRRAAT